MTPRVKSFLAGALASVVVLAPAARSAEPQSGTLIEAWASVKSFVPKDDGDPPSGIDGERDGLDDMVSRFADQPVVDTAAGVTRRAA